MYFPNNMECEKSGLENTISMATGDGGFICGTHSHPGASLIATGILH